MTTIDQPNSQAERARLRAEFRARIERPNDERAADDHDAAVEAFIDQLAPLRRVHRGLA
jgi:hypothetical protein